MKFLFKLILTLFFIIFTSSVSLNIVLLLELEKIIGECSKVKEIELSKALNNLFEEKPKTNLYYKIPDKKNLCYVFVPLKNGTFVVKKIKCKK